MKAIKINLLSSEVIFHEKLVNDPKVFKCLLQVIGENIYNFCLYMPPIFLKRDKGYILISRHFSYDVLLHGAVEKNAEITALLVEDNEIDEVIALQRFETRLYSSIGKITQLKMNLTPAAVARKKHREAAMFCPLCESGILQGPKNRQQISEGEHKGKFRITCFNKSDKKKTCDFAAYLTPEEMRNFRARKLATAKWLEKTTDICPQCNKRLFMRMLSDGTKTAVCEEFLRDSGVCQYSETR